MRRALVLTIFLAALVRGISGQALATLHITVSLNDATGRATPVAGYALLISDNPQTVSTRRVVTTAEGTAQLRLRPGNYTVESDQPVVSGGRAFIWTARLNVAEGRDSVLALTTANASSEPVGPGTTETPASSEATSALSLEKWRTHVVAIWTPTTHASGFVIDAQQGLVVTNHGAIGTVPSVEVQLSPSVKVAGNVLVASRDRDVAVLRIDPTLLAGTQSVPLDCTVAGPLPARGQEVVTLAVPIHRDIRMSFGEVLRVQGRRITADLTRASGSAGGPVFTEAGDVIGITATVDPTPERLRGGARIVHMDEVCAVVADARGRLSEVAAPSGDRLPVEPTTPFPTEALQGAASRQTGRLEPYRLTTDAFDVAMLTPRMTYAARSNPDWDFLNWSAYVAETPPVLLVRATPKVSEGFWARVARGAASTQGIALPKIERFQSGFLRMVVRCGAAEVTPIHPFRLQRPVSPTEAIHEGFYAFDPGALGPHCGTVTFVLYAEKEPSKADTRIVDPATLQRIWDDFAPYRALANP
jgi:hypothetical protein